MVADRYRVLHGLDYPGRRGDRRAEPGDIVTDLPQGAVEWLVAQGAVEPVVEEAT